MDNAEVACTESSVVQNRAARSDQAQRRKPVDEICMTQRSASASLPMLPIAVPSAKRDRADWPSRKCLTSACRNFNGPKLHRVDCRFQRAFEIVEINFARALRAPFFQCAAGGD